MPVFPVISNALEHVGPRVGTLTLDPNTRSGVPVHIDRHTGIRKRHIVEQTELLVDALKVVPSVRRVVAKIEPVGLQWGLDVKGAPRDQADLGGSGHAGSPARFGAAAPPLLASVQRIGGVPASVPAYHI